jgi:hypothetical protein
VGTFTVRVEISQERVSAVLVPGRATALVFESRDEQAGGRDYEQCMAERLVRRYFVAVLASCVSG